MGALIINTDGVIEIASGATVIVDKPHKSYIDILTTYNNFHDLVNSGKSRYGWEKYHELEEVTNPEVKRVFQILSHWSDWCPVSNTNNQIHLWKSYFAYFLATIKHETANYLPRYELYNSSPLDPPDKQGYNYFKKYDGEIGNIEGTEDFWTYRGRGFIQLTGRDNYVKCTKKLKESRFGGIFAGIDLVADPDKTLQFDVACVIASYGMLEGWFTKHKIYEYMGEGKETPDFFNARRVVNGLDKADIIENYAWDFFNSLVISYH